MVSSQNPILSQLLIWGTGGCFYFYYTYLLAEIWEFRGEAVYILFFHLIQRKRNSSLGQKQNLLLEKKI